MTKILNYYLSVLILPLFIQSLNASLPDPSVFDFVLNKVKKRKKALYSNKTDENFLCFRTTINLFFRLHY